MNRLRQDKSPGNLDFVEGWLALAMPLEAFKEIGALPKEELATVRGIVSTWMSLFQANAINEALGLLEIVLKIHPSSLEIAYRYCVTLACLDRADEAYVYLKGVEIPDPKTWTNAFTIAQCCLVASIRNKKGTEAVTHWLNVALQAAEYPFEVTTASIEAGISEHLPEQ